MPEIPELTEKIYLKIDFGYSGSFLFPYKNGIKILNNFQNALVYRKDYQKPLEITDLGEYPQFSLITADTLRKEKMESTLLSGN